jgi:hypothetical protein
MKLRSGNITSDETVKEPEATTTDETVKGPDETVKGPEAATTDDFSVKSEALVKEITYLLQKHTERPSNDFIGRTDTINNIYSTINANIDIITNPRFNPSKKFISTVFVKAKELILEYTYEEAKYIVMIRQRTKQQVDLLKQVSENIKTFM